VRRGNTWGGCAALSAPSFSHMKQAEAAKQIEALLKQRGLEIQPGIVLLGADEAWSVFEYRNRCIGIDPSTGIWIGPSGESWECIARTCSVSGALQAVEFLTNRT
jgi:hypothetical protein